ncbi:calcium-binding protein [Roseobacter litoralis]|uniref:calcium-binding protein n=1 Tax=Roseobacter litoralis TaxID=42443 RepID=UPI0024952065|nr:hypothetical protein [Roseobacter litoralis]
MTDSRTAVVAEEFVQPYTGIGALATAIPSFGISRGTGFYIGTNTVLTAWHVIDPIPYIDKDTGRTVNPPMADGAVFISGSVTADSTYPVQLADPSHQLKKVTSSDDIGIITNTVATEQIFKSSSSSQPYVFGLDAYLDYENYLQYRGTGVEAKTAGFPLDKYDTNIFQEILPYFFGVGDGTLWRASGTIVDAETLGNTTWVSDSQFSFNENREFVPVSGQDGTLDAIDGQSGSPLWTQDPLNGQFRAMGVLSRGHGDENNKSLFTATYFEIIDQSDFSQIMLHMVGAGATQPDYVTNRITGTYNNNTNEFLEGGPFKDVLRGLGALDGAKDFLSGGAGDDVYVFEPGAGEATVQEPEAFRVSRPFGGFNDAIDMTAFNPDVIRISRAPFSASDHLFIYAVGESGAVDTLIEIRDQFPSEDGARVAVEQLILQGLTIDLTGGLVLTGQEDVNDDLFGTIFDDELDGLSGVDTLRGGDGDDTLISLGDGDDLLGGKGSDYYVIADIGSATIRDDGGFMDIVELSGYSLEEVRLVKTTNSPSLSVFSKSNDEIEVFTSIDLINQFSPNGESRIERLDFAGDSTLDLRFGLPITGSKFSESLLGTSFDDIIDAGGGGGTIQADDGNDVLIGGDEDDVLRGGSGNDTYVIRGNFGRDIIIEPDSSSTSTQSGGSDMLRFGSGSLASMEVVRVTSGLLFKLGPNKSVLIKGQDPENGEIVIEGIAFGQYESHDMTSSKFLTNSIPIVEDDFIQRSELEGNISSQQLINNDTDLDEGDVLQIVEVIGDDGIDVELSQDGSFIDYSITDSTLPSRSFTYIVSDGVSRIPVVATIWISSDTVLGTAGNDYLIGTGSAESIYGFAGADRILGFSGDDTLFGGDGADVLNGGNGDDEIRGGDGDDIVYGGDGADFIFGDDGDDLLIGSGGDDEINGDGGDDSLRGGDGDDVINGGDGDDVAFGGQGTDSLFGGSGNDRLFGSGGNDLIDGEGGDDSLVGEGGADTLLGGDGNDGLGGGGGDDFLDGGNGNDRLFGGSNEDMLLGGAGDDFMQGNQQNDELFGESGNDQLFGGDGRDLLDGGSGNDRLEGGDERDILVGGLGADVLLGGTFGDTFKFNDVDESNLVTMDLIVGVDGIGVALGDVIDVSGIDADTATFVDDAFTFLGLQTTASALSFGAGALWLENANGPTMLFGNVDDDAEIEFAVRIDDGGAITAADYTVGDFIV